MLNEKFRTGMLNKCKEELERERLEKEKARKELAKLNCGCNISLIDETLKPSNNGYVNAKDEWIRRYHSAKTWKYERVNDEEDIYLGFELEVYGGGEDDKKALMTKIIGGDDLYTDRDGSLNGNGFEIITNPMTIEKHKTKNYKAMLGYLKSVGYLEDNTKAGLHVHVSRNFFGYDDYEIKTNVGKTMIILENNFNILKKLARRGSGRYNERIDRDKVYTDNPIAIYQRANGIGKYAMVNVEHSGTIEFRSFAGTLTYDILIATLEFVLNLSIVAKNTDISDIKDIGIEDIVAARECPYLVEYCKSLRIQF